MTEPTIVTSPILWNILALDTIARAILADNTAGVSTGDYSTIVLLSDTSEIVQTAETILNGHEMLSVETDVSEIDEGAGDVTITCNDVAIADDTEVGYVVLLDGEMYDSGTDVVTGNSVSLILTDPVDGVYEVYVYRLVDNYASGYVIITVNEVV